MSDKPNLFITALNAFEFKEITEVHNAHLKMLLDDDETRPRGCRRTTTRQHLGRLLKYYPRHFDIMLICQKRILLKELNMFYDYRW